MKLAHSSLVAAQRSAGDMAYHSIRSSPTRCSIRSSNECGKGWTKLAVWGMRSICGVSLPTGSPDQKVRRSRPPRACSSTSCDLQLRRCRLRSDCARYSHRIRVPVRSDGYAGRALRTSVSNDSECALPGGGSAFSGNSSDARATWHVASELVLENGRCSAS